MIQDVKTWYAQNWYIYVCHQEVHSCSAFIWKCHYKAILFRVKLINVGVVRGVATRMAQVVWPMMTVTVTNFEGFARQQFCKNVYMYFG